MPPCHRSSYGFWRSATHRAGRHRKWKRIRSWFGDLRDKDAAGFGFSDEQRPPVRGERAIGGHVAMVRLDPVQRHAARIDDPYATMAGVGDIQPVMPVHRQPIRPDQAWRNASE